MSRITSTNRPVAQRRTDERRAALTKARLIQEAIDEAIEAALRGRNIYVITTLPAPSPSHWKKVAFTSRRRALAWLEQGWWGRKPPTWFKYQIVKLTILK